MTAPAVAPDSPPAKTKPLRAPDHLQKQGKKLWAEIANGQYVLRPDEQRVLQDACRQADLIERLEEALRDGDLLVPGPRPAQMVANPLIGEIRMHRATLAQLVRQLHLPDSNAGASQKAAKDSENAQKAARARWDKKRTGVSGA